MFAFVAFLISAAFAEEGALVAADSNALRYGIDISSWQSTFNGQTAKNNGVSTVFCRAGYWQSQDRCWTAFVQSATNAGLQLGSYHFATWHYSDVSANYNAAMSNAKAQAQWFVNVLKTAKINTYAALDLEMESGHKYTLTKAQLTDCCIAYMDVVKAAGYSPILYASASWFVSNLDTAKITAKYPIWVAYYFRYGTQMDFKSHDGSFPSGTYGNWMKTQKAHIKAWQFSSEGFASKYGCAGTNLDKNYLYY